MTAASDTSKPRARLLEWRALRKNALFGFAVVELPSGLVIRDVSVHEKAGRWWVGLPARPQIGHDDRVIRNHSGKVQYSATIGWRDRDLADRFSAAVVDLVRAEHPSDLAR
jgi:hypothetical protein